jgi:hypothetical protein
MTFPTLAAFVYQQPCSTVLHVLDACLAAQCPGIKLALWLTSPLLSMIAGIAALLWQVI